MTEQSQPKTEFALIKAHGIAALAALIISVLFGLFISTKMHMPDMAGTHAWSTWGRLRFDHTQGIFFGWLGNVFLLFLYYVCPRFSNREVFSRTLGWVLFVLWNFVVLLPGWAMVLAGQSQALEWAEFPLIIDAMVVLAFVLSIVQFVLPILSSQLSSLYVSAWYIIGGLVFTLFAYPVGNLVPQLVPGTQGAAFSGLWIHDAIGLYVTPLVLAIAYWVIPARTHKPIYSHALSMLGFWLLFFVYPLNGTHHYVFSSIPMEAQLAAITASVILGIDVIIVVANLLLSLKGSGAVLKQDMPLRFILMGIICYLIVALQGSMQALMPVNRIIHFSDWVIGHSHLAMIGFASFIGIGGLAHVWQNIPEARFSKKALSISYWLLLAGLVFMVGVLTSAGLIEANFWQGPQPWLDSVRAARGYWIARTISGVPIFLSFIALCFALFTGPRNTLSEPAESEALIVHEALKKPAKPALLNMAYLSASVAGLGLFLISFGLLGIAPGLAIESDLKKSKPATMMPLTASEMHGREIYAREGCAYCHTQQVRKVQSDAERFGMPTRAWETVYDYPQLWGTRRVGPDLARETGVRSDDWQLAHLFSPRSVVKDSVMPPYPWLFDGSVEKPNQDGQDLLAFIKSLGRERQLAGITVQAVPEYCDCSDDVKAIENSPIGLNANASAARRSGPKPIIVLPVGEDLNVAVKRGSELFAQNCASCHGEKGNGESKVAASLLPAPANLTVKHFSLERLSFVLSNGVYGTSMPAWRDLPHDGLVCLAAYVRSLGTPVPAQSVSVPLAQAQATPARELFTKNCSSCHGVTGGGNGPAAASMAPTPTNFHTVSPSPARALMVINNGIEGSSMPPWKEQLSLAERGMLASYVASLYKEKSP